MSAATVTSKGQVTIPADVRRAMGIGTQDKVTFTPMPDGTVVMRVKNRSMLELGGMLKPAPGAKKVEIEDMNLGQA